MVQTTTKHLNVFISESFPSIKKMVVKIWWTEAGHVPSSQDGLTGSEIRAMNQHLSPDCKLKPSNYLNHIHTYSDR